MLKARPSYIEARCNRDVIFRSMSVLTTLEKKQVNIRLVHPSSASCEAEPGDELTPSNSSARASINEPRCDLTIERRYGVIIL